MNPLSWLKLHYLKLRQDKLIFVPTAKHIEPMHSPQHYGLEHTQSINIRTEDNVILKMWYKPPNDERWTVDLSRPVFLLFHGNAGHWGDVGKPKKGEEYDRRYRIKLLKAIGDQRMGFIAVSLRGYGKSQKVAPSENGFILDVKAILHYALDKLNIPYDNIIILGESLGASVAMIAAEAMMLDNKPPAVVGKVAAFSSLKWKVLEMHPDLHETAIKKHLRHHFNSAERLSLLTKDTHLYIAHPDMDESTGKHHSEHLADTAKQLGLTTTHEEIQGGHITWDPEYVVKRMLKIYENHKSKISS